MKLVADHQIPKIHDYFANCDEIVLLPSENITSHELIDADILLTRTVTAVDETLLRGSNVKFVGTATSGTDHVECAWLLKNNIAFADTAGANAIAVAEYVMCVVAVLTTEKNWQPENKTVGVIGCGRIGRVVATLFQTLNCKVICYDPLISPSEKSSFELVSFEKLMSESDLISLHTPLTRDGLFPTFHMINDSVLEKTKPYAILINTARGSVIDQQALLKINNIILCCDVWENEPVISRELLEKSFIATPHIAGYSINAKNRATEMLYEKAAEFFQWPVVLKDAKSLIGDLQLPQFNEILKIYNPLTHTHDFRALFMGKNDTAKIFLAARNEYRWRETILFSL